MNDDMIVCLCERIDDLVREVEEVRRENLDLSERLEWYRRREAEPSLR